MGENIALPPNLLLSCLSDVGISVCRSDLPLFVSLSDHSGLHCQICLHVLESIEMLVQHYGQL